MLNKIINIFTKITFLISILFQNIFAKNEKAKNIETSSDEDSGQQKEIKTTQSVPINTKETETGNQYVKDKATIYNKIENIYVLGMKINKNKKGQIIVEDINENSPAYSLGLRKNDVIIKIDDVPAKEIDINNLGNKIMQNKNPEINIIRRNRKVTLNKKETIELNEYTKQLNPSENANQETKREEQPKIQPWHKPKIIRPSIVKLNTPPKKTKTTTLPPQIIIPLMVPLIIKQNNKEENQKQKPSISPKKDDSKKEITVQNVSHEKTSKALETVEKVKQQNITKNKEVKKEKQIRPEDEAKLLNKIIEQDIKNKELQVLKNSNNLKTISNLISEDFTNIILPLPLLLFRYRTVMNFFSMITLSNALTAAKNVLNQNQNYYIPSYFTFLSKRKTLNETEMLTIRNLSLINNLKEDLIKCYGKQVYTNNDLKEILEKLDELEQNLNIRYAKLLDNKNQKVKKRKPLKPIK